MLVVFTGSLGQGKTFSMSVIACALSHYSGLKLYSNYGLKGAQRIYTINKLLSCEQGILCFDEAHTALDSRMYKDNVKLTHFLLQTRKKGLIVFMTTQIFGQVDMRARDITDYIVACKKKTDGIWLQFINWQDREICHKRRIDQPISRFYNLYDTYEIVNSITMGPKD